MVHPGAARSRLHVAFHCKRREDVDAFYEAAIAAGAEDNGKPGLRPPTTPTTTAPSSSTRTATTSRRSATRRSRDPLTFPYWPCKLKP